MDLLLNILTDENNRWLLLGLGLLAVMYFVVRPVTRRKKDPLSRPPRLGLSQQRSVEREMSNLLVELSEMARQITAQLDTRAARLELLMKEADERIAELKAMQERGSGVGSGEGFGVQGSGFRNELAESPDHANGAVVLDPDPRHVEVYELADQGSTPHDIAEKLGRPSGEIELILALRSKS